MDIVAEFQAKLLKRKHELSRFRSSEHSWLEVSTALLIAVGVDREISSYSYMDSDLNATAYLEESCDESAFRRAMKSHGVEFSVEEFPVDSSEIEKMPKYNAEGIER